MGVKKEITVINSFLPKQLNDEETKKLCQDVIKTVNACSMKDMGKVMGVLKSQHADILEVSEGRIDINDKSFTSIHIIKNNLNKKFLMKLEGNIYNLSKMKLIVLYNNEKLATISLKNIH